VAVIFEEVAMRYLAILLSLLLQALFVGPLGAVEKDDKTLFVPFAQFLASTKDAKAADYIGKQNVRVRDEAAFQEMRSHILSLYEGVTVKRSFVDDGRYVDCVPFDQQPSLRGKTEGELRRPAPGGSAVAPPKSQKGEKQPRTARSLDLTLSKGKRDRFGNEMYCAKDTVPIRRITIDDIVRFPTLSDFLRAGKWDDGSLDRDGKIHPNRINPADTSSHYYARGYQFVDNFGSDAWLNVWSPTVATHHMSLSQLWVVGSEGEGKQTIEAGWQVYPDKWNSDKAALFIFYTTKNYSDGCYNLDCAGFVQIANNVYLGRGFTNYSATNATQWGFNLQWKRHTDGNWWLFYKGPGNYIAVGYYPKSLFGSGALASKATKVAYGGEDSGEPSAKQMGSGALAAEGWQKAAYQNRAFYIDTSTVSQWANLTKYEPNPECYTATINNIFGSWGTYLYFGGPKCK
jgi:hypothetical protein